MTNLNCNLITFLPLSSFSSWKVAIDEHGALVITDAFSKKGRNLLLERGECLVANGIEFSMYSPHIESLAEKDPNWVFCFDEDEFIPNPLDRIHIIPLSLYPHISYKESISMILTITQVKTYIPLLLDHLWQLWADKTYLSPIYAPEWMFKEGKLSSLTPLKR